MDQLLSAQEERMVALNMGGGSRPVNIPTLGVFSSTVVPATGGAIDWRVALTRLDGAYSPHTVRSYRADFASFEA
jgi:hypothetical protein